MQGNILTIFGGSGFIASEIVYKLSKSFNEVRLLTRNTQACNHLKVIKNIQIHLYDPSNVSSYSIHINESDIIINTVGILNESRKQSFDDIHFNFVKKIIIVFGEKDSFFNRFKSLLKLLPVFPLACPNSMFSPVYVKDLTEFIKESSLTDKYDNMIQNVTGPKDYKFIELINFILSTMKIKRLIIPLNYSLSKLQAFAFTYLPGNIFTLDNFRSLQVDNISSGGLKGTSSIEEFVPPYLENKTTKLDTFRKDSGR